MTQVGGVLKTIAKDFNIAALVRVSATWAPAGLRDALRVLTLPDCKRPFQVTNHVTRGVGGEVQPGLGMSWSHVPRTRILLERVEGAASAGCSTLRSATLIKSSRQVRRPTPTPELSADPDSRSWLSL